VRTVREYRSDLSLRGFSVLLFAMSDGDKKNNNKKRLHDEGDNEGPRKRARPTQPAECFRLLVVDIGEEFSATTVYVIEGDGAGRDAFEALLMASKALDPVIGPLTSFSLIAMTDNSWSDNDSYSWWKKEEARAVQKQFQELAVTYHTTVTAYSLDNDAVQGWMKTDGCCFLYGVY
jgi:hypothetical protein